MVATKKDRVSLATTAAVEPLRLRVARLVGEAIVIIIGDRMKLP